jgi:hypothetical protein
MGELARIFQKALEETWNDGSRYGRFRHADGDRPQGMFMDPTPFEGIPPEEAPDAHERRRLYFDQLVLEPLED